MFECADRLSPELFRQVLGESIDTLDILALLPVRNEPGSNNPGRKSQDRLKQLLRDTYPLCPGEPEVHLFAEVADLTFLKTRRWPIVCLLWPDLTEDFDKSVLSRLLARLRDLHADKVIHVEATRAEASDSDVQSWSMADSLALGFTQNQELQDYGMQIYEFDIRTYKPAPDWLNSKHWANPEMWEKHRW